MGRETSERLSAPMQNFTIVRDHPSLLKYIEHLQAQNSDALGFLPRLVFEKAAESSRIFLGLLNGEPAGYILAGSGYRGLLRCPQVCIQYDARRRLYGAMLVAAVEKYGESIGCFRRVVRCGSDLESNAFWESVGYFLVGTDESGDARKYKRHHINLWTKPLFPAVVATAWVNGRPRIYASNAARQKAYELRRQERDKADGVIVTPGVSGRPKIYASDAHRLRAWRERKRNLDLQNCAAETNLSLTETPVETKLALAETAETVILCPTAEECRKFAA